jgi:cytochrome P450
LTFWYEFYYELYPHQFQYGFKIKQLHAQYGPIVRINPIHLHIHDHEFIDAIYAGGSHRRDRCSWWHHVGSKTMAGSMLEAIDHDLHKSRRGAVSSFFSKRSVLALEPLIFNSVEKLLQRFRDEQGDKIVNLNYAFAAMTLDVISAYCFGESMDTLSIPEYGKDWLDTMHNGIQSRPVGRQFPWLVNTILDIPPDFMAKISSDMAKINGFTHQMLPKIERILAGENEKRDVQKTIFHHIRDGDLSKEEKEPIRLMGESHILLGAGGETTARTLAVTTYYIMKKQDMRKRLRHELKTVMPQPDSGITLAQLEALPYLVFASPMHNLWRFIDELQSAIINEGLRVAHGVSSRQPRIATHEDLIYKQWTIPRGTPVMQSAYLLHTDPNIFPDPLDFQPQRWLDNPGLKRHLFAFGRGSRSCLGMK